MLAKSPRENLRSTGTSLPRANAVHGFEGRPCADPHRRLGPSDRSDRSIWAFRYSTYSAQGRPGVPHPHAGPFSSNDRGIRSTRWIRARRHSHCWTFRPQGKFARMRYHSSVGPPPKRFAGPLFLAPTTAACFVPRRTESVDGGMAQF